MTARPCSSATAAWWAIEPSSARSSGVNGVSRSQTSSPIWRRFQRSGEPHVVGARTAPGPRDLAVLEHERGAGRADGLHRRLHDRLERLLEVERLRDRLRDPRERLELRDPPLRLVVELRVLDRLRDLARDREQQLDLVLAVLARLARADVERARELLAREDRHRQDRLVLVLGKVREALEARVELGLRRDRDRRALGGGRAGDPLAGPHPRPARHLLDARAVGRAEDELVGALVVQVDEARVGLERGRDLARDEREHLLEVERRVDRLDRLGEQAQVPVARLHPIDCRGRGATPRPAVGASRARSTAVVVVVVAVVGPAADVRVAGASSRNPG